jgi:hypothetical protein
MGGGDGGLMKMKLTVEVVGTIGFLLAVEEGGGGEGEVSGLPPLERLAGRLLLQDALAHHRPRVVAAHRHHVIFLLLLLLLAFHLLLLHRLDPPCVLGIVCLHPSATVARRSRVHEQLPPFWVFNKKDTNHLHHFTALSS